MDYGLSTMDFSQLCYGLWSVDHGLLYTWNTPVLRSAISAL